MITITISDIELYDNASEEFMVAKGGTFRFEHSLKAIAKWESKWKVPFLNNRDLTNAQLMDYYRVMCLDKGLTKEHLIPDVVLTLAEYIADSYTATTFQNENNKTPAKIMTSEVVYAMMVAGTVPFECDAWNINRLMALLRVVATNQTPPKQMSRNEILMQNSKLNAERKAKLNTKG